MDARGPLNKAQKERTREDVAQAVGRICDAWPEAVIAAEARGYPRSVGSSDRFDPKALPLANRHYNRQTPTSPQFVPPGRCIVLLTEDCSAVWVSSWPKFARHAWVGAWVNSLFRNEGGELSSDLIRAAVAHTRSIWPEVPDRGMVTFVNPSKVRHKRDPGRCYLKAGFRVVGKTKGGLVALQMLPDEMPDAEPIYNPQGVFALAALSDTGGEGR